MFKTVYSQGLNKIMKLKKSGVVWCVEAKTCVV
jgi:hypothetical protein